MLYSPPRTLCSSKPPLLLGGFFIFKLYTISIHFLLTSFLSQYNIFCEREVKLLEDLQKGDYIRLKDGRFILFEVISVEYDYGVYSVTYYDPDLMTNITSTYDKNGKLISNYFTGDNMDIVEVVK